VEKACPSPDYRLSHLESGQRTSIASKEVMRYDIFIFVGI
jgi:hypothetical protein